MSLPKDAPASVGGLVERIARELPQVFLEQQPDNRVDGIPNLLGPGLMTNRRIVELVLEALGYVTCPHCKGVGINDHRGVNYINGELCPDCVAGVQPSDEMRCKAKKALDNNDRWLKRPDAISVDVDRLIDLILLAALPGGTG